MTTATPTTTRIVSLPRQLDALAKAYTTPERIEEPVYFDTETTGLNASRGKLVALQLKQGARPAVVVDCRTLAPRDLHLLGPIFADGGCLIVGHNLKFALQWLWRHAGLRVGRL